MAKSIIVQLLFVEIAVAYYIHYTVTDETTASNFRVDICEGPCATSDDIRCSTAVTAVGGPVSGATTITRSVTRWFCAEVRNGQLIAIQLAGLRPIGMTSSCGVQRACAKSTICGPQASKFGENRRG